MSTRTEFPAVPPVGICWGFWQDEHRTMRDGFWDKGPARLVLGWAPCELPAGHVSKCGPRSLLDADIEQYGERACHVVTDGQQVLWHN